LIRFTSRLNKNFFRARNPSIYPPVVKILTQLIQQGLKGTIKPTEISERDTEAREPTNNVMARNSSSKIWKEPSYQGRFQKGTPKPENLPTMEGGLPLPKAQIGEA
jgi:hypothetical protein